MPCHAALDAPLLVREVESLGFVVIRRAASGVFHPFATLALPPFAFALRILAVALALVALGSALSCALVLATFPLPHRQRSSGSAIAAS